MIVERSGDPFDNPAITLSLGLSLGWSRPSSSGYAVTHNSLLAIPPVKRAVQKIAGSIAKLDLLGYRIGRGGSRILADDHPCYNLLHWRPSPKYGSCDWKYANCVNVLLHGISYNWIIRNDYAEA